VREPAKAVALIPESTRLCVVSHACVIDVNQKIYRELERLGYAITIVVPNRWRHSHAVGKIVPHRLQGFNGRIVPLEIVKPGSVPLHAYAARLRSLLETSDTQALYIEEEPYSVAAFQWTRAARQAGVPSLFDTRQNIAKIYPLPFRLSERYVWRHSRAAVCLSESVEDSLRSRGYVGRTHIVPLATDVDEFSPGRGNDGLRQALSLADSTIGFLGRLVPEKGIAVLLDAFAHLRRENQVSLLCVGGGPMAQRCRAQPGVVVVEGVEHSAVPDYLRLMDVVVLPSLTTSRWKEQFGRVAMEAMACGVPVVGSDSGEIPTVFSKVGGGVTFPEGDSRALAAEIRSLLSDPQARRQLGEQGRDGVSRYFSLPAVASELVAALDAELRAGLTSAPSATDWSLPGR
jgi:glycosyltransferase involved in cell wall biosynthesis